MDRTYRVVIAVFRVLFRLLGLRIDVRGLEHVPARGPAVLASNHTGYLDFALVGLVGVQRGRRVRFMAKRSTFDNPVTGPAMRAMRHIPVDRAAGTAAARKALRALAAGELLGTFPEATISRSWLLKDLRPGAVVLAKRAGVPLVPVVTWGGHRVLTVDRRGGLRRGKPVTVLVGEPIETAGRPVQHLHEQLRERLTALADQAQLGYPDRPRNDRDRWWLPAYLGGTAPTPDVAARLDAEALMRSAGRTARRRSLRKAAGRAGRRCQAAAGRR
ncbi:MAG TPA: lysophospholipid acyltransferase family protein [Dermatophilaceae bacterium]|nr:lysophospholipid acyltransferase family protein [Dermatophilaceae bacterium]